jgi:hypothetical protein
MTENINAAKWRRSTGRRDARRRGRNADARMVKTKEQSHPLSLSLSLSRFLSLFLSLFPGSTQIDTPAAGF